MRFLLVDFNSTNSYELDINVDNLTLTDDLYNLAKEKSGISFKESILLSEDNTALSKNTKLSEYFETTNDKYVKLRIMPFVKMTQHIINSTDDVDDNMEIKSYITQEGMTSDEDKLSDDEDTDAYEEYSNAVVILTKIKREEIRHNRKKEWFLFGFLTIFLYTQIVIISDRTR